MPKRDGRRAASHRFDHVQAERLRPINWRNRSERISQKIRFGFIDDLSDEFDVGPRQQGPDNALEVVAISHVYFCRDLERYASPCGNLNCPVWSFFGRNPPDKRQVFSRAVMKRQRVFRQSVIYISDPICLRKRTTLAA